MINVERESIAALYMGLQADYIDLTTKDLDTKDEQDRQKNLINNLQALIEFMEKLGPVPEEIKADVDALLETLNAWDVYAFWFKEVKELVGGFQQLIAHLGTYLSPKSGKRAPVKPSLPKSPLNVQKPAKPSIRPVTMLPVQDISPRAPSEAEELEPEPSVILAVGPDEAGPEIEPLPESKPRAVPRLKPVFKRPPVRVAARGAKAAGAESLAVHEGQAIDVSVEGKIDENTAPQPLKVLVDEHRLKLQVKPAKIMKPVVSSPAGTGPRPGAGQIVRPPVKPIPPPIPVRRSTKLPPPAKPKLPSMPAIEPAEDQEPAALATPAAGSTQVKKPAGKGVFVPKPVKINVPDLDEVNIEAEVAPAPARKGPIAKADQNEAIMEQLARDVKQQIDAVESETQLPAGFEVDESGFITPGSPGPEDIDEGFITPGPPSPDDIGAEIVTPLEGVGEGAAIDPTKLTKISSMLDDQGTWNEDELDKLLTAPLEEEPMAGQANDQSTRALTPAKIAPVKTRASPVKVQPRTADEEPDEDEFKPPSSMATLFPEKGTTGEEIAPQDKSSLPFPFTSAVPPTKSRPKGAEPAEPKAKPAAEQRNSMSNFMGALQSKKPEKPAGYEKKGFPFFQQDATATNQAATRPTPAMPWEEKTSTAAGSKPAASPAKKAKVVPLGSEVDISTLPETKDGLYQSLIALEGKRYSIERAKKDARSELDKGAMNEAQYQARLVGFKNELDTIAERINIIREKLKML